MAKANQECNLSVIRAMYLLTACHVSMVSLVLFNSVGNFSNSNSPIDRVIVPPYENGERTCKLRDFLAHLNDIPLSDLRLICKNGTWSLQNSNNQKPKFQMQGRTKAIIQGPYLLAMSEDKQWSKFKHVPASFQTYIETLPMQYDDLNYLSSDGKEWFIRNNHKVYRKLIAIGMLKSGYMTAMSEDGILYSFNDTKDFEKLKGYLKSLPQLKQLRQKCETNLKNHCPQKRDNPVFSLRQALGKAHFTSLSDDSVMEKDGAWFLTSHVGKLCKIIRRGYGSNYYPILAQTDEFKWYKFLRISRRFACYLSNVTHQYDLGYLVYNGQFWYVLDKTNRFKKISMRVAIMQDYLYALTEDGYIKKFFHRNLHSDAFIKYVEKLPLGYCLDRKENPMFVEHIKEISVSSNASLSRLQETINNTSVFYKLCSWVRNWLRKSESLTELPSKNKSRS